MVWIRRIIALLILLGIAGTWYYFAIGREERRHAYQEKYAQVIAEMWVGTAKYRQAPDQYNAFRDSLLAAYNMNEEDIRDFQTEYEDAPEEYLHFSEQMKLKVDSLVQKADSTIRAHEPWGVIVDSLFDTTGVDSMIDTTLD